MVRAQVPCELESQVMKSNRGSQVEEGNYWSCFVFNYTSYLFYFFMEVYLRYIILVSGV